MAKSIEQLKKELALAEAKAAETKKRLREAEKTAKRKQAETERREDTRRKILMGGFWNAKLKQNSPEAIALFNEFLSSLEKDQDKALFDSEKVPDWLKEIIKKGRE